MEYFLCEVFCVPHWNKIENLDNIIQDDSLHYLEIFRHPRISFNIGFIHAYSSIMGCEPSIMDVHDAYETYVNGNTTKTNADRSSSDACIVFLKQNTFFRLYDSVLQQVWEIFKKPITDYENLFREKESLEFVKQEVAKHLDRRLLYLLRKIPVVSKDILEKSENNSSLFQRFQLAFQARGHTAKSFYENERQSMRDNSHDLMHENIFTQFILYPFIKPNWKETLQSNWITLTKMDCIRFQLARDVHFIRENMLKPCIYIEWDERDPLRKQISDEIQYIVHTLEDVHGTPLCIFHTQMDVALLQSTLPRIFGLCVHVKYGGAGENPYVLDKTLNMKNVLMASPDVIRGQNINTSIRTCFYMVENDDFTQDRHLFFSRNTLLIPMMREGLCTPSQRDLYRNWFGSYVELYLKPILANMGKQKYFMYRVAIVFSYILKILMKRKNELGMIHRMYESKTARRPKKCILFIHNQPCFWGIHNSLITWMQMDDPTDWEIVFYGSESSIGYFRKMMGDTKAGYFTHPLLENAFDRENYNMLMKDQSFWRSLLDKGYTKGLIVQDDSLIIKKGFEKYVDTYDYIGAAWKHCSENDQLIPYVGENLVGNGGLSLRSIDVMLAITQKLESEKRWLFNSMVQQVPEDVYFAMGCNKLGKSVMKAELADRVFIEENFDVNALGFHKFWVYNDMNLVDEYFAKLMM